MGNLTEAILTATSYRGTLAREHKSCGRLMELSAITHKRLPISSLDGSRT